MTCSPAACSALALAATARVADSATAPMRWEMRLMAGAIPFRFGGGPAPILAYVPSDPVPDIRIPADLLPADGRFGSGPSKVRPEAAAALAAAASRYLGTSHRRDTVKSVVGRVRAGL